MKMYKTNQYVLEIAKSDVERMKGFRAEFEEQLKGKNPDYPEICGGFHGSLDCAIRALEWLIEEMEEVDEDV